MPRPIGRSDYARLYNKRRWRRLRVWHRQREPLCRKCKEHGIITPVAIVDHIIPHRGDLHLFFDERNLQSLCVDCHDKIKARDERAGVTWLREIDASGWPVDPKHPANLPRDPFGQRRAKSDTSFRP